MRGLVLDGPPHARVGAGAARGGRVGDRRRVSVRLRGGRRAAREVLFLRRARGQLFHSNATISPDRRPFSTCRREIEQFRPSRFLGLINMNWDSALLSAAPTGPEVLDALARRAGRLALMNGQRTQLSEAHVTLSRPW